MLCTSQRKILLLSVLVLGVNDNNINVAAIRVVRNVRQLRVAVVSLSSGLELAVRYAAQAVGLDEQYHRIVVIVADVQGDCLRIIRNPIIVVVLSLEAGQSAFDLLSIVVKAGNNSAGQIGIQLVGVVDVVGLVRVGGVFNNLTLDQSVAVFNLQGDLFGAVPNQGGGVILIVLGGDLRSFRT